MKIVCDKCEKIIDRDKYDGNKLIEEYKNKYGTCCPYCGNIIKPIKKLSLYEDRELKMEILKKEMIEKIKKKIRRK